MGKRTDAYVDTSALIASAIDPTPTTQDLSLTDASGCT